MSESWTAQGDLFTLGGDPVGRAPGADEHRRLARALPPGVRLGTSSWSFPGWSGIVYDRPARREVLSRHGLAAYARHPLLRTVCVDRSWYGPVEPGVWRRWATQVPDDFRFVAKADRVLTTPGTPDFLDADLARSRLLDPMLDELGERLAVVILQFPPLDAVRLGGPADFASRLHRFLSAVAPDLPPGLTLATEIRDSTLFGQAYADALDDAGGTHVHTVHPRAAPLAEQLQRISPGGDRPEAGHRPSPPSEVRGGEAAAHSPTVPRVFERPLVVRWMLRPTLSYEAARDLYHPFDRLEAPDPERREVIAEAIVRATSAGEEAFIVVNNKAEGSSPLSVIELARSVARRTEGARGGR